MLKNGQLTDLRRDRNLGLLNDEEQLQNYIDDSLIPMVDSSKSQ